jgi:hypothetical protein
MNNEQYKHQVGLLIRIMPAVYQIKHFAVHGGTAINLFHQDMPRYSIDIDLTYIPIEPRTKSLENINQLLRMLKASIERTLPGISVIHKEDVYKLQCSLDGAMVKIEVNATKRGVLGNLEELSLCPKAQAEFQATCKARLGSYSLLYGGKIIAALSRQHPRDLFDCRYMKGDTLEEVKNGLLLSLLGSDKPIIEVLTPHNISQEQALENQFRGMTDIPFSYADYEQARQELIKKVNASLDERDKTFLLSFEKGEPKWDLCIAGNLSAFPSVQWKQQNILKLKAKNIQKFQEGIAKLSAFLGH